MSDCRACGGSSLTPLLDLGEMPLAGGFLKEERDFAGEERYPLAIHICESCCLVQIVKPVDPAILFSDYAFASSTVGPLVDHFRDYAKWIEASLSPRSVIEFGCNDGILLQPLEELGIRAVGVDLAPNITAIAREKGLSVYTGAFDVNLAEDLADTDRFDLVTGSNAFAHNADPGEILRAADVALGDDGVLCLEFMYAGDLLEQVQWDTLYHEHLTFYSLGTIERLLADFGFSVFHAERLPMHGGSLRIAADRGRRTRDESYESVRRYEEATALNQLLSWKTFSERSRRSIGAVKRTLRGLHADGAAIWAYGAAGKATMWLNACDLSFLGGVVDSSPLRAGRYMPGTHTPIVLPDAFREADPDFVFVTAWNYAGVIRSKEEWFGGYWVTPLPELVIS